HVFRPCSITIEQGFQCRIVVRHAVIRKRRRCAATKHTLPADPRPTRLQHRPARLCRSHPPAPDHAGKTAPSTLAGRRCTSASRRSAQISRGVRSRNTAACLAQYRCMTAQARMHRKALTRWNFKAVSSLRAVSMARDRTPKRRCEVAKPLADTVERITMFRACVVCLCMLLPAAAMACESGDRRTCMEQFRMLIAYRTQAIEAAFGDLFGGLPEEIEIRFVTSRDHEYDHLAGRLAYDPKRRMLIFPRRVLSAKTPNPLRWASYYWPFYQDERYQNEFPIIGEIDTLLWNAYLQEAALAEGLNWPHRECVSARMSERLPCEMLIKGVAEHVKAVNGPLFNQNRIDRIWP